VTSVGILIFILFLFVGGGATHYILGEKSSLVWTVLAFGAGVLAGIALSFIAGTILYLRPTYLVQGPMGAFVGALGVAVTHWREKRRQRAARNRSDIRFR